MKLDGYCSINPLFRSFSGRNDPNRAEFGQSESNSFNVDKTDHGQSIVFMVGYFPSETTSTGF